MGHPVSGQDYHFLTSFAVDAYVSYDDCTTHNKFIIIPWIRMLQPLEIITTPAESQFFLVTPKH